MCLAVISYCEIVSTPADGLMIMFHSESQKLKAKSRHRSEERIWGRLNPLVYQKSKSYISLVCIKNIQNQFYRI